MAPSTSIWSVFRRGPLKVSIMGSGNWGSAISRIIGDSAASSYLFHDEVLIWVFDEEFEGKMISKSINEDHQNPKYLPGYKLPSNVRAVTDAVEAIEHADLIVFVLPHQFVVPLCQRLASHVKSHAKAISLVKGLHIHEGQPYLFSDLVTDTLDVDCSVLSGANVANDIARGEFSETTIGYSDKEVASIWQQLFDTPFFRVNGIPDVRGVEVCGAVKNVIALAAGFCDGLGLGSNSKAAIMRMGLAEMKLFALLFFDGILEQTFFDSAGFADVVTTCYGGRNVRCAAEFIRRGSKASWAQIENDMLHGQKLQGTLTCKEVFSVIASHNLQHVFPLFTVTYAIAFQSQPARSLIETFQDEDVRPLTRLEDCVAARLPEAASPYKQRVSLVGRREYASPTRGADALSPHSTRKSLTSPSYPI